MLCFLGIEPLCKIGGSAKLVIYHETLNFTDPKYVTVQQVSEEFSNPGILNNVLPFFRLKGLKGIICSLPLTLPHSETCTGSARIHWSCLVFSL